ncbi:hypothetical protein DINM_002519 [Dirofilaria immitis]|nr:hypothetical protein [Dirofilaria immitis]
MQGNKIRQLSDELRERTAQITRLMAQLPFATIAETTGSKVSARIHFHSQPNIHWNPAPASFLEDDQMLLHKGTAIRLQCKPRSHHLPSLHSKPNSVLSPAHNIEKPSRLQMLSLHDQLSIARSLYEIQNFFIPNNTTSSNPTNSKALPLSDRSIQNTI